MLISSHRLKHPVYSLSKALRQLLLAPVLNIYTLTRWLLNNRQHCVHAISWHQNVLNRDWYGQSQGSEPLASCQILAGVSLLPVCTHLAQHAQHDVTLVYATTVGLFCGHGSAKGSQGLRNKLR